MDVYLPAGILGNDAADLPVFVQLQMLCRRAGEDLHRQIVLLDGVQHGVLHMGAAPAGADGVIPAQQVFKLPVAHFQNPLPEHGAVEVRVRGFFQGVGLGDVAEGAQPVKEVACAVDRRAQQPLIDLPVTALREGLYRPLPLIGNAQLLVPLGIGDHISVGKVGVASQLVALFQHDDLFARLSRPDGGHKPRSGANHHHITVQGDGIVLADDGLLLRHLMAGPGMT